jgi:hypothetical protein
MNPRTDRSFHRISWLPCSLALLACLNAAGCAKPVPVVSGTVTLNEVPLTKGEIHFVGSDGKSRSSVISSDGFYKVVDAPVGRVKVAVVSLKVEGEGKLGTGWKILRKAPVAKSVIPLHYNDPEKSGLSYDIEASEQTINVELKDQKK